MNAQQQRHIVVGVDGTADNVGALRYATAEAAARKATLRLVHVVPDYVPVSPMLLRTPVDLAQVGAAILEEAAARVRALDPDAEVEGWLRHGTRPDQLAEAGEGAEAVVVGRDDRPLLERLVLGDTATGVAARATVPVVEVPADWQPREHRRVVVGVKGPKHAGDLLAAAFDEARRRGADLEVLHAWKLPSVYDDIIEVRVDLDEWRREAAEEMEALVRDWRTAYPDVTVELRVVHDRAGHALVEASRRADLVMVVRRQHGVPAAAHLGGTARAVLRLADCPVVVVAPVDVTPIPPLVLERHGELAR
ncbi:MULTISPECIES: universal stress protein [unclassified Nocardioides]|uniref:universal stress protein n=1 Tax=unclassified Nocardioides TaxID=2615069 RepID=UPI00361245BB